MLQIIGTQKEIENLLGLLPEVLMERISALATILDENYGKDRNIFDDDGGYICIAENDKDIAELKEKHKFDLTSAITEYCDQIPDHWLETLTLTSNDFGIVVLISSNCTAYQKLLNEYD